MSELELRLANYAEFIIQPVQSFAYFCCITVLDLQIVMSFRYPNERERASERVYTIAALALAA